MKTASVKTALFCLLQALLAASPAFCRVLNVCDDVSDPMTLDPLKQFSEKNYTVCWQIFDGLVRFDPDGKIEPALAVSWERVESDRMRFHLRHGVAFHNGEPFDSEAVRFSIERYLDPATGFPAMYFIDSISRAEVVDQYTVDIVTKRPDAILLNRLAGLILIVPPKYLKEKGGDHFARHPVGTGAFVFQDWVKGERIELAANKNYWLAGYPKVDGLVFKFIPSAKQVEALLAGEIDLLTDLPGTQTLKVKSRPDLSVVKKASFYTMPFSLNLSSGPLSSVKVRKALNHAVNKANLIRYDLLGNGSPIATLSMPGEMGHDPSLKPYAYDPAKAKRLLAEAGYPDGFTMEFLVKKNAERFGNIIAADLGKVGVKLRITLVSDAEMIAEFRSGRYGMFTADVPDPLCHASFIQWIVLFSKSPYAWGGDARFDDLLTGMMSASDTGRSRQLAEDLDRYVYDNAMSVFTYQKTAVYGINRKLHFTPYVSRMPQLYGAFFYEE
ncbi:MAG: ABC transporter substrate-binding protein [Elusimicrobiales bacterium]|nr:ABC transporter substrate-binding protein [Elusimicrobiales bacterium]